jgi:methionyl-tRNA synthetase
VIGLCINIAYLLSTIIYPYMPNVTAAIRRQLNVETLEVVTESKQPDIDYNSDSIKRSKYSFPVFAEKFYKFLDEGHKIGKAEPLFKRIGEADAKSLKERFAGKQQKTQDAASGQAQAGKQDAKKEAKKKEKQAKSTNTNKPAAVNETDASKLNTKAAEASQ